MKKIWKTILSLCLCLVMVLSFPITEAYSEGNGSEAVNRFNVVLVVDGSGSLRAGDCPSDPSGLRYDALKLFLGLLTESGNNVGSVVFNEDILLDSGLLPMNNMSAKLELVRRIEEAGATGETNIGGAILRAVNLLEGMHEENGLPCAILLLSDGKTELNHTSAREQASRDANEALQIAIDEGIAIHGILLDVNNGGAESEILFYTQSTGGTYEEVSSADDLTAAFQRFYAIINNTEYNGTQKTEFGDDGTADVSFVVPRFGVEEVNIVVELKNALQQVQITKPDGSQLSGGQISSMSILTSRYQLIKIPAPMAGMWRVHLEGVPHDTVDISMLYNASMNVQLSCSNTGDFLLNTPYHFQCIVQDTSMPELTKDDLSSMTATLHVINSGTQESWEYPMTVADGYHADVSFPAEGSYYVYASVGCDGFLVNTDTLLINVGNKPPVCTNDIFDTIKTGLFQSGVWSQDISANFTDPEGEELTFSLASDSYGDAVTLDGGQLSIDVEGQQRVQLIVVASDPLGASAEMRVDLVEENVTVRTLLTIGAVILVLILLFLLYKLYKSRQRCSIEMTLAAFDSANRSLLRPLYNFHGKRSVQKLGSLNGANAKNFWFEATSRSDVCLFKGKVPFYLERNGRKTKSAEIKAGIPATIYFDPNCTCGLKIDSTVSNSYRRRSGRRR